MASEKTSRQAAQDMNATQASANTTGSPRPVVENVTRQVSWLTACALEPVSDLAS
jgi:hypothetical protein